MYSPELIERLVKLLAPDGFTERSESETLYPLRKLNAEAKVMRVPPSPTGMVHIGTVYAGFLNERIAHQSGGIFILRIEDTDKKREIEGATNQIINAFRSFELAYDEGPDKEAAYGPYFQSERGKIYMGYALELLKNGRAYPCFATPEELQAATRNQQAKKQRPGYYGEWALWRDKPEAEVTTALNAGKPFVLRFKSNGDHQKRIIYTDAFKGKMEVPENDLDVPLIKSDEYRLPTYHLAHVVDDFLMRVSFVLRSDEWLPSTALHIELAQALGIEPFTYGHFAPISIIDKNGGGKRKLSKRKDPEADVQYWLDLGYPIEGIKAYLLGLANSNFEEWYRANPGMPLTDYPFSIEKLAASRSPLLDMSKMEDYCKDYIARLPQSEFENRLKEAFRSNEDFLRAIESDPAYTSSVMAIERDGDKPRKDLSRWSDATDAYGYFFDSLFEQEFKPGIAAQLEGFEPSVIEGAIKTFLSSYAMDDTQEQWFDKLKTAAEQTGFALDNKSFKETPEKFKGNVADFARILRVKLTGKNKTPDLWTIMKVMGPERVVARLNG
ncbi:glutamate--tRNA ligase family protein [soil metagenome]